MRRNKSRSLDHLVGASEQRRGHGEPEFFGRLEVNDELKLGRLFDRESRRVGTLENLVDVGRCPTVKVWVAYAVRHQAAVLDKLSGRIDRRQPMLGRKLQE